PPCMSRYPTSALSQPAFRSTHPLLASEYDNMLACIRCGLCLTSCPTYVLTLHESEGPRGRVGMARAVAEGHLQVTPDLLEHELPGLAEAERLLPEVPRRFFTPRGESYPSSGRRRSATAAVPAGDGAVPAGDSAGLVPEGDAGSQVSIFAGCVMSTALADIDRATLRVLLRAGFTVRNPAEQGCCGALHAHGGDLRGALALARSCISAFEGSGGPIVVNSAGCGAM